MSYTINTEVIRELEDYVFVRFEISEYFPKQRNIVSFKYFSQKELNELSMDQDFSETQYFDKCIKEEYKLPGAYDYLYPIQDVQNPLLLKIMDDMLESETLSYHPETEEELESLLKALKELNRSSHFKDGFLFPDLLCSFDWGKGRTNMNEKEIEAFLEEQIKRHGAPDILIDKDMVVDGIVDASTGRKERINIKNVTVPSHIIYENKIRTVAGINFEGFSYSAKQTVQSIKLPSTLKYIGDFAFYECSHLKKVELPKGLIRIGGNAFSNCHNLKSISIPRTVTSIGQYAFKGCKNIQNVFRPSSTCLIGEGAFYGCEKIKIYLDSQENCSDGAFYGCKNLIKKGV
ncbi:hypothetical protein M2146_001191 [Lachnospiraceae bacterium PF1-22]